jgi:hypothetical protein
MNLRDAVEGQEYVREYSLLCVCTDDVTGDILDWEGYIVWNNN